MRIVEGKREEGKGNRGKGRKKIAPSIFLSILKKKENERKEGKKKKKFCAH